MRVLLACLIVLLAPAAACASEVTSTEASVTFSAASGELNRVTIGYEGAQRPFVVKVEDAGADLVAGAGCLSTGAHTAQCVLERVTPPFPNCVPLGFEDFFCEFRADLGDADDTLVVGLPDRWFSRVDLGGGNDALEGTAASVLIASGGAGDDRLLGGEAPDILSGGPGADFIQGRGGTDRVTYAEPDRSTGVRVRIDDAPGDGAPGEGDDIRAEWIEGTAATDVLIGNDVDNRIIGNGGDDRIVCRGGVHDEAITANLTDAAKDCERVGRSDAPYIDPLVDGPLIVRGRAVKVKLAASFTEGRLRVATLAGRRLGAARVPADSNGGTIRVPLRRKLRRTLPVRVTAIIPGVSLSRVVATLRPQL